MATIPETLQLAVQHHQAGRLPEAEALYRQILQAQPDHPDALHLLGVIAHQVGQHDAAIEYISRAIVLNPRAAEYHNNIGETYRAQGKKAEAVACYEKALAITPAYADAHNNLGLALSSQGKLEEAATHYRQALALQPDYAEAMNNLGSALQGQGKLDEGVAQYRQALAFKPDYADAHSNLLFGLHYLPTYDSALLGALYREWNEKYARHLAPKNVQRKNRRESERPLRVGYVSGDFKWHPVGHFVEPVLEAHDKSKVRVYCYSMVCKADDVTLRLQGFADAWRNIVGMSDEAVAGLIREDGIDILVDLSGHTAGNRLLVFARKPAPVQVTWIGFCAPTGLETMDYLLADGFYSPPEGTEPFAEQLVRLPANHLCFRPPAYAPPVSPCLAFLRGYPTFGCFNNLAKVNAVVVATWAKILHGVPGARLVLKTYALNDHATRERYRVLFQEHGISSERVDLLGFSPHAELLAHYGQIDIALDPFPYCGGWSTCEALWMGTPVVTLTGISFSSCVGAGLLSSVGLPQLIAKSVEQYVECAVQLGLDVEGLARLREGLRARMAASPLCDAPTFTHHLEQAYRTMWRKWCGSRG